MHITLENALARLDAKYELSYVSYDDSLTDEQVAMIVRGDYDAAYESICEYESDSRWEGVKYVIEDTFTSEERAAITPDDMDEVRYAIEERDESDLLGGLIRNTSDPLLRIIAIEEDDCFSFEPGIGMGSRRTGIRRSTSRLWLVVASQSVSMEMSFNICAISCSGVVDGPGLP